MISLRAPLREAWSTPTWKGRAAECAHACDGRILLKSPDGRPLALDAATGRPLWTYPWAGQPLLVHEGAVFAWIGDAEVHLLDVTTGRPRGCLQLARALDAAAVGRFFIGYETHQEYGAVALRCHDWTSGRRLWTHSLPDGVGLAGGFATTAERVVFGRTDGELAALETDTGLVAWKRSWPKLALRDSDGKVVAPTTLGRRPITVADRVVVSLNCGRMLALGLADGGTLWEVKGGADTEHARRLYALGDEGYQVFDAETGARLLEKVQLHGLPEPIARVTPCAPFLVSDTRVFAAGRRPGHAPAGVLMAFERDTGRYAWGHLPQGAGEIGGGFVVAEGRFFYDNGGRLYCLEPDAASG